MKRLLLIIIVSFTCLLSIIHASETQCHPQCSWKCDDPHCPAICDPVCEPPKCHTSCAEPKNAICDVKCEKPECEIKCPDKGCEMFDCPKCVTVCKQPHCVTHCQAPKPECEPVCEEPRCDWKCHKPNCPKPKCELVCENPNCVPKVECCNCAMGQPIVSAPFPFFKETEANARCCGCNQHLPAAETPQVQVNNPADFNTMPMTSYLNNGNQLMRLEKSAKVRMLPIPVPLGTGQLTDMHHPRANEYLSGKTSINIDKVIKDRLG